MTTRIRFRRDTAANWTSVNPVLALGEVGIETDTQKIKAGDGTTAWTSLGYVFASDFSSLDTRLDALEALPATRAAPDLADLAAAGYLRVAGTKTGVALTTKVLVANTIYAALYEPTAGELAGTEQMDSISLKVTADGSHCHIGIWEIVNGVPDTLIADSGAKASTVGNVTWAPTFTPELGKLYAIGLVVDTGTTITAVSANSAALIGIDTSLAGSLYTHFQGSFTYGALSDFPTVSMSTGTVPLFAAAYSS